MYIKVDILNNWFLRTFLLKNVCMLEKTIIIYRVWQIPDARLSKQLSLEQQQQEQKKFCTHIYFYESKISMPSCKKDFSLLWIPTTKNKLHLNLRQNKNSLMFLSLYGWFLRSWILRTSLVNHTSKENSKTLLTSACL